MDSAGRMQIVGELCSLERRLAGTDAERRAASWLARRLREVGRRAELEPIYVHPQVGLVYGLHALVAFAGSLVSVEIPALGFGLVLLAATSVYLDLNARLYLLRRLLFRRASQNVVSPGGETAPATLVISAHYDAARAGSAYSPRVLRLLAGIERALRVPVSPSRILFWAIAILIPIVGARMAGFDSDGLSVLQLVPTMTILVGLFGCADIALSAVVPGANDNASGVATALSLADELESERPANLDVWVVLTGGGESAMQGMRSFLRSHREALDPERTYVLTLDSVGHGDVRYVTGEGLAVTYELASRLTALAADLADAHSRGGDRPPAPLRHGFATDALPARLAGIPATTITCLDPRSIAPANVHTPQDVPDRLDPGAIQRAHDFALGLIRLLDRDVGRRAGRMPAEKDAPAPSTPR